MQSVKKRWGLKKKKEEEEEAHERNY